MSLSMETTLGVGHSVPPQWGRNQQEDSQLFSGQCLA